MVIYTLYNYVYLFTWLFVLFYSLSTKCIYSQPCKPLDLAQLLLQVGMDAVVEEVINLMESEVDNAGATLV